MSYIVATPWWNLRLGPFKWVTKETTAIQDNAWKVKGLELSIVSNLKKLGSLLVTEPIFQSKVQHNIGCSIVRLSVASVLRRRFEYRWPLSSDLELPLNVLILLILEYTKKVLKRILPPQRVQKHKPRLSTLFCRRSF
jgi:hypothetical protein